mgnify:FL=1
MFIIACWDSGSKILSQILPDFVTRLPALSLMLTCAASLTQIHRWMDHPRYETFKQGFANTKLIKLLLIIPRGRPAEASFHRVSSSSFAYCVILTILQISFAEMSNGVTISISPF